MTDIQFADLHCHPQLRPYGHSFRKTKTHKRSDIWYHANPSLFTKWLHNTLGLAKFTQADFTNLSKGNVKLAFVSLYPIEKGLFINASGKGLLARMLGAFIGSVAFPRVRYVQRHVDYFHDLLNEYDFLRQAHKERNIDGQDFRWKIAKSWQDAQESLGKEGEIAVVLTIEGAHVFNTGLEKYGRSMSDEEVIGNVYAVKKWENTPLFITFAHHFNNDLCGHARSLHQISRVVDQTTNINRGFSSLGKKVIHALLDDQAGNPIYIDIKHMSVESRKEYINLLKTDYASCDIPLIVSHGGVTGTTLKGERPVGEPKGTFNEGDINFFDEELVEIAESGGLFALQVDRRRLAGLPLLRQSRKGFRKSNHRELSAQIVWNQIQHVAEVLNMAGLPAWDMVTIGSDFDGNINPLYGYRTAKDLPSLAEDMLPLAAQYLQKRHDFLMPENRHITPEEIVQKFAFQNAADFLKLHY